MKPPKNAVPPPIGAHAHELILSLAMLVALHGCVVLPPPRSTDTADAADGPSARSEIIRSPVDYEADVVTRPERLPGVGDERQPSRRMTAELLQSELLAYADRYLEGLSEAADWGADHAPTPKARAAFRQIKVVYVTSAVTVVTEPDPLRVLRDLLVMVRLQLLVWEGEGFTSWATPEAKTRMLQALRRLDAQIVLLAQRVLPQEAIDTVLRLTAQWHDEHPGRRYVAFTRFTDLTDSVERRRLEQQIEVGGLLAPVTEAVAELNEMRRVAERGIFLANHLPLLLEWQAEALVYNVLKLPELQTVLDDLDRYAQTGDDLVAIIETLPAQVRHERALTIEHLAGVIRVEREATLSQLSATLREEREALVRALTDSAGNLLPLAEQLARTAEGSRETVRLITTLQGGDSSGEEFDMQQAQALVNSVAEVSSSTHALVLALTQLLDADATGERFGQIDDALARHELRLFGYAAALVVLTAAIVLLSLLVFSRLRQNPRSG